MFLAVFCANSTYPLLEKIAAKAAIETVQADFMFFWQ
jgi:hypothetical protein